LNMDQHLVSLLAEIFGLHKGEIVPELTKDMVGSWDSLKQMDLVTSLENEYEIVLEISDIIKMKSVASIIDVLAHKGVKFDT